MPNSSERQELYSPWVGLVFVFNLIVGTGALTLPSVFVGAGWLLSTVLIILLAFFGFVTVTFMIESMACANATIRWNLIDSHKVDGESDVPSDNEPEDVTETTAIFANPRSRYYTLTERVEVTTMANLYFSKSGRSLFALTLCIYLYGDLSIYAAAIAKTLSDITCDNATSSSNVTDTDRFMETCVEGSSWTRMDVYRSYVLLFVALVGPFAYLNLQKTKYLQVLTSTMRWTAFSIMIVIAITRLCRSGPRGTPVPYDFAGVPALLGASVYSFMCHHSIPGLISPFAEKKHVVRLIGLDYLLICLFYLLLALTGSFAFRQVSDLYTLNFEPSALHLSGTFIKVIECFLVLFPVFTLSTSFPIVAITLQNNLQAVFLDAAAAASTTDRYSFVFPTLAILPPTIVALSTHNLRFLVEFTGCFAGAAIQYVAPALLVWAGRKNCLRDFGPSSINRFASPFKGSMWIGIVLCWSAVCVSLVVINFFRSDRIS